MKVLTEKIQNESSHCNKMKVLTTTRTDFATHFGTQCDVCTDWETACKPMTAPF